MTETITQAAALNEKAEYTDSQIEYIVAEVLKHCIADVTQYVSDPHEALYVTGILQAYSMETVRKWMPDK